MSAQLEENLISLMQKFDSAMLVTRTAEGQLRSRPMAVARVDATGELWFATDRHSGKVDELQHDSHVNVALQGGGNFVSVSGTASFHDDRALIDELWKEPWRVWFPGGKDDPSLILLKVDGSTGEYWDNSGAQGLKYLIKAGRAYLTGERPKNDPDEHGKVAL